MDGWGGDVRAMAAHRLAIFIGAGDKGLVTGELDLAFAARVAGVRPLACETSVGDGAALASAEGGGSARRRCDRAGFELRAGLIDELAILKAQLARERRVKLLEGGP